MRALETGDPVFSPLPDLSDRSDTPAHTRIEGWLVDLITGGRLREGDKLPSEVELAATLGVSRMTLRQALGEVERLGHLQRRRGRFGGNFVTERRFNFSLAGLPGFTEQMRTANVEPGARVVSASTHAPSADVRSGLRLKRGARVHEVIRVRFANGDPVALEEAYFPAALFPNLLDCELTGSLYGLMGRNYDRPPHAADELIEPLKADDRLAELLDVEVDSALLLLTRTTYDSHGIPVEFSRDHFRPDRTRIMLRTSVDNSG